MPHLRLYLLGAPSVELNTKPISLTTRKGMALLAYMALTQQVQQRNALATLLWPASGQQAARTALRRELNTITSTIGDGIIMATRSEVALMPDAALWTDVDAFQQRVDAWSQHDHAEDALCRPCMEALTAAATLYRGDLLADLALTDCAEFEEWRALHADGLRRMFGRVANALAREQERRGEYDAALTHARRRLELEPLHEPSHRQLMRLHALAGQLSAALRQYKECVRILRTEVDIAPQAATTELYEMIRTRRFPTSEHAVALQATQASNSVPEPVISPVQVPHNLPTQATSFVGREDELAAVCQLLLENEECRLLTLLGPGGIGKTRLALQVAQHLIEAQAHFPDGIYFVPLTSLTDITDLVRALASAVGYAFAGTDAPQTQLENFLRSKRLLLIVDNFEHLLQGAQILEDLMTAASRIICLVTSREALNLAAEWIYPLGGLVTPSGQEPAEELPRNSAVQLFIQRARQVDAGFAHTTDTAPHIVRICQLVDGMPLGLELAASWVHSLTLEELGDEIASNIDILASELRNIPQRHRSLRAVFQQTWGRLTEAERRTLRRLAIFRGTFTREAAQQITGTSLLGISALVHKTLCRYRAGRYDIHELLRQFAFEHLDPEEAHAMQTQHGAFFGAMLEAQQQFANTSAEDDMLRSIEEDFDNILGAWRHLLGQIQQNRTIEWCASQVQRYVPALAVYFDRRSLFWEGQRNFRYATDILKHLLDAGHDKTGVVYALYAQLQVEQAGINRHLGNYQQTRDDLLALLPQLRAHAGQQQVAAALTYLGAAHMRVGEYTEAERSLAEAIAHFEQLGLPLESTYPLINLGLVNMRIGKHEMARAAYQKAVDIYEEVGYATGLARCLNNIGSTYVGQGNAPQAIVYYERGYEIARQRNNRLWIGIILSNLADCAHMLDNHAEAVAKFEEALVLFRELREMRWVTVSLADSSFPLIKLGHMNKAAHHLIEALRLAQEYQLIGDGLQALSATALLCQYKGEHEWAITVATHVLVDTRSHDAARENCTTVRDSLAPIMPDTTYAAACFRGESTPFALMISDTIRELDRLSIS